jgi:hypothetical protein
MHPNPNLIILTAQAIEQDIAARRERSGAKPATRRPRPATRRRRARVVFGALAHVGRR